VNYVTGEIFLLTIQSPVKTPLADDHRLLGIHNQMDQLGSTVCNTQDGYEIIDEGLFNDLTTAGLKKADTLHLMYACPRSEIVGGEIPLYGVAGAAVAAPSLADFLDERGAGSARGRGPRS